MSQYGLLQAMMNVPEQYEEEFNAWYDTEHVPQRRRAPGFLAARRWVAHRADFKYLAHYDLDSPAAVETEVYRQMSGKFNTPWTKRIGRLVSQSQRTIYEQIFPGQAPALPDSAALLLVGIDPDPAIEADFNAWYDEEHVPLLLKVPGFRQARRFRVVDGGPKYLAVYDLAGREALHPSPELQAARSTPWYQKRVPHLDNAWRGVYLAYQPAR